MANPHPTPRLENLRPPWQPGTSGNPAGYSQGRRISDAMEGLIDELGLQREFGTAAIAMALGKKHLLKQKVTDLSRSWASSSPTSLQAIWLPARSWPGKLRPPWDPGGQVDVSDALSGACTGKAPGWQAGPNVENLRTGTRNVSVFSSCFGPRPRSTLKLRVSPQNRRW